MQYSQTSVTTILLLMCPGCSLGPEEFIAVLHPLWEMGSEERNTLPPATNFYLTSGLG